MQCTDDNEHPVAAYTLKLADEPDYVGSSGCMLTIDEGYPHLAPGQFIFYFPLYGRLNRVLAKRCSLLSPSCAT